MTQNEEIKEQIKPLGIRLVVRVDIGKYKSALARIHNVKPEEVEVIIENSEPNERETFQPVPEIKVESPLPKKPTERKEKACGITVGRKDKGPKHHTWLHYFLLDNAFSRKEAAQLCAVTYSTITRACRGTRLRDQNFNAIVRGLEMTPEEERAFKDSLIYTQRNKDGKERLG